jgi:Flp pilus assembly protein TadD
MRKFRSLVLIGAGSLLLLAGTAQAGDKSIHITLPKKSKPTPVQQLNRDGVAAIEKHQYDKAKKLFYQAYLLDPNDPFTLNNLGYIAELEGKIGSAQRYYALASAQDSDAVVERATAPGVQGKPVSKVAGDIADTGMQINRLNVTALDLLLKDRAPEADLTLQKALALDPKNPFTLNNMGFAKEKEGELETALAYYTAAANLHSSQLIMVTANKDWRGRPISEVADENAKKLRKLLRKEETPEARVKRLNLQGVSAMNRNDRRAAVRFFEEAYRIDPNDAFTLNNMGFLAEMQGDKETADFYYDKAREAKRNSARVDVATRRDAEGQKIGNVAQTSDQVVQQRIEAAREAKQREGGPIELKTRNGQPVTEPTTPPASPPPPQGPPPQ